MPGPNRLPRPVNEEIDELKSKLALLDGDKKAYYESSKQALQDCKKRVGDLRKDNSKLRLQLRDRLSADDHVINQAFQNKPTERAMLANKTTHVAIETMDYKVCDGTKKLNSLRHQSGQRQQRLDELKYTYEELSRDSAEAEATLAGMNKEGQRVRDLENRLDKATLKCNEADHICKTYEQIKSRLEEEHLNYGNNLTGMESEIRFCQEELRELRVMRQDAELARDAAMSELRRQEELVYTERRRRDVEIGNMRQVAQERQQQQERVEKRIAARESASNEDDDRSNATVVTEEQQRRIADFEEAFKIIKEATGVSDLEEVVLRFENQGDTQKHLDELRHDAEREICRLREEQERLRQSYVEMKYTGETKMSSGQKLLEEYQSRVDEEEVRRSKLTDEVERTSRVQIQCRSGVEHLFEKLRSVKMAGGGTKISNSGKIAPPVVDPSADEFVLDMLSRCEERLLQLLELLSAIDIELQVARMNEEENKVLLTVPEFQTQVESKLPTHNVRVKLPQTQKENVYEDDEESGDDDADVLTRNAIKKQSQQIVDMKTQKRNPRKKKKSKGK